MPSPDVWEEEKSPRESKIESILMEVIEKRDNLPFKALIDYVYSCPNIGSHWPNESSTHSDALLRELENYSQWDRRLGRVKIINGNAPKHNFTQFYMRFSDYLAVLGYNEEEHRKIFERLNKISKLIPVVEFSSMPPIDRLKIPVDGRKCKVNKNLIFS